MRRADCVRKRSLSVAAIIVAAGSGTRFGSSTPKQFLLLDDKPLALHSVYLLGGMDVVKEIILVVPKAYVSAIRGSKQLAAIKKPFKVIAGGKRRQDSVCRGLRAVSPSSSIVLIHDGVRPFPPLGAVRRAIASARKFGAAILACPAEDTVKLAGADRRVAGTIPRKAVWLAQTPQVFSTELIRQAYRQVMRAKLEVTDDAAAIEAIGGTVKLVVGSRDNLKITTRKDFLLAKQMARRPARGR
jgi:2-C-methyl-D-erythritol 4-phosphate cytidylyltransferase